MVVKRCNNEWLGKGKILHMQRGDPVWIRRGAYEGKDAVFDAAYATQPIATLPADAVNWPAGHRVARGRVASVYKYRRPGFPEPWVGLNLEIE
jgi:hypothetical protein